MQTKRGNGLPKNYIMVSALLCICFLASSFLLIYHMMRQNDANNIRSLHNAAGQNTVTISKQIQGDLQTLEGIALIFGGNDITDNDEIMGLLREFNKKGIFKRIGYAQTDGTLNVLDSDGTNHKEFNIFGKSFFQEALAGKKAVSEPFTDSLDPTDNINYYAVPVKGLNGKVRGVLCAVNSTDVLREITDAPLLNGSGYSNIVNSEGGFVIRASSLSPDITGVTGLGLITGEDQKLVNDALAKDDQTDFTIHSENKTYLAVVQPIHVNDWFVLSVISKDALRQNYLQIVLGISIIILIACSIFLFLLHQQRYIMTKNQEDLSHLAYDDEITGYRNYRKFLLDAKSLMKKGRASNIAFWYCDIKNFKYFNDVYGYREGDRILCRLAGLFDNLSEKDSIFCRVSADNFAGVRPYSNKAELEEWFFDLINHIQDNTQKKFHSLSMEISMGFYCVNPEDGEMSLNDMVNRANMAQKSAKSHPGSQCAFFTNTTRERFLLEAEIEAQGRDALNNHEFIMNLQPKVAIQNGNRIAGAEVLCRWLHPKKGLIPPDIFIPVFEKNDMIVDLDRYMFDQVCRWLSQYLAEGRTPISIAVNVSRYGLLREDFIEYYGGVKEKYQIPDKLLELELTESVMLDNEALFLDKVMRLKKLGFICSLDDFGTGYSSLNLLKNLPIDVLKLDILFFRQSVSTKREQIVVSNIINMARELSIMTIAEGVESVETVDFLRKSGCDIIQGYVFSEPLPLYEFDKLLRERDGIPLDPKDC